MTKSNLIRLNTVLRMFPLSKLKRMHNKKYFPVILFLLQVYQRREGARPSPCVYTIVWLRNARAYFYKRDCTTFRAEQKLLRQENKRCQYSLRLVINDFTGWSYCSPSQYSRIMRAVVPIIQNIRPLRAPSTGVSAISSFSFIFVLLWPYTQDNLIRVTWVGNRKWKVRDKYGNMNNNFI